MIEIFRFKVQRWTQVQDCTGLGLVHFGRHGNASGLCNVLAAIFKLWYSQSQRYVGYLQQSANKLTGSLYLSCSAGIRWPFRTFRTWPCHWFTRSSKVFVYICMVSDTAVTCLYCMEDVTPDLNEVTVGQTKSISHHVKSERNDIKI